MLTLEAHAKINLTLEVLGRRDDGYHDIASIMQTIDLHDTLAIEPARKLAVECDAPDVPTEENLVLRAARVLQAATGATAGAHMTLAKAIPVAAGLGGGSSDAAAALVGLNQLWRLGLSVNDLTPLAAQVGSDVPFFLHGGTAMVSGRGERVRPLPPAGLQWLVLLVPDIRVERKTATVYSSLPESSHTRGMLTRKLEARIRVGGDTPPQFLFNGLEDAAMEVFPGLRRYWDALRGLGAPEIRLAGSGPALYAPVSRREVGTAIHLLLQHRHGWQAHLASTWQPAGQIR